MAISTTGNSGLSSKSAKGADNVGFGLSALADVIQSEILPRLLVSHSNETTHGSGEPWRPSTEQIEEFSRLTLGHDHSVARCYVTSLRESGIELADILVRLMGPAARFLGELWRRDLCDFTDVTIGLNTMHALTRELCGDIAGPSRGVRALLVPFPGEQHAFGIRIIAELARLRGWDVVDDIPHDEDELIALVENSRFETVGLSIGVGDRISDVRRVISKVRQSSLNRDVSILVGGVPFLDDPALANKIGADGTADNAMSALNIMDQWIDDTIAT